ncbi:MAG: sigma-70 family RNA polymerase sigma factor [Kiritimatiellae bacterium]|nr:sigma-70 family RNA polymerase sigma factor [Kiritimatiellia bacterium]
MTVVDEIRKDRESGAKRLESEYKAGLMAFARRFCANDLDAEALVYRTFSEVIERIDGYTEQSAFFGWMCKILVNCHANDIRRRSNQTVVNMGTLPEVEDDGATRVVEAIDAKLLREAVENLPPEMKEAVLLRYFMDLPLRKISQILAQPIGTVKSRLYYARVMLAQRLGANLKKPAVALIAGALLLLGVTAAVVGAVVATNRDATAIEGAKTADGAQETETTGEERLVDGAYIPSVPYVASDPSISSNNKQGTQNMNIKTTAAALMTAATALGAAPVDAEPIGSGLAAYLTFDDAVLSNRVPNATITGVTLSDSGIASGVKSGEFGHSGFGGYLDIDQGWARLDGSQNLTFENGNDFTIMVWMRAEANQVSDPLIFGNGNWNTTSAPGVLLSMSTIVRFNYSINGTTRQSGSVSPELGKWVFYAISHTSDGKFRYYYSSPSGVLTVANELDAPNLKLIYDAIADRKPFYLGQDGTGAYSKKFVGKLDEFALWTRGLQQSDIESIYRNGRKGRLLDELLKPAIAMVDAGSGNIDISFAGARSGSYELYVASGAVDGGVDRFAWDHFDHVATIAPTDSSYTFALSNDIKNEGRYYRFFLTKDANYQEVAFTENTSTALGTSPCIDTGFKPTSATSVSAEIEFNSIEGWEYIFGSEFTDGGVKYYYYLGANASGAYDWNTESKGSSTVQFGSVSTGVRYGFDFCVTNVSWWTVSGAEESARQNYKIRNSLEEFPDSSVTMYVFRGNPQTSYRPLIGKMYSFAVRENGETVRDYVPAVDSSGVAGLYEVLSKTFHPSETAYPFTAGSVVSGRLTVQSETAKAMTASDPITAYWVGGASGDVDEPSNWHCVNSYGTVIEAVPQTITDINIANASQMFSAPANSVFACKSITVGASVALASDFDWRGVDMTKVSGTLDLAGHKLYLAAADNIGNAVTFTDLTGGGELHVEVASGKTVVNTAMALAGAVTLVKDGAGTFIANRQSQTNSGGVRVDGGILATTAYINTRVLGASGSKVVVACGTLRIENGYTGLDAHDLELAGGTLHMYNSEMIAGRSVIGSLTQTEDSVLRLESTQSDDGKCDTEFGNAAVWDLGGKTLTIQFVTASTDLMLGRDRQVKPIFRNGTVDAHNQLGHWLDYGVDATNNVCLKFGMKSVRQYGDSKVQDYVNDIPSGLAVGGSYTMSIYGTYTPNSDIGYNLRLMNGATVDLGARNDAWPISLGNDRIMVFEPGATINIELGDRQLTQGDKIVSWSAIPAGVTFVNSSVSRRLRSWSLVATNDGIYVQKGMAIIIR